MFLKSVGGMQTAAAAIEQKKKGIGPMFYFNGGEILSCKISSSSA